MYLRFCFENREHENMLFGQPLEERTRGEDFL
jgi:hypothetical protein